MKGMLVTRYSYKHDIVFRVKNINDGKVLLHGEDIRLEADAAEEDLRILPEEDVRKRQEEIKENEEYSYRLFRQDYQLMKEKKDDEHKKQEPRSIQRFQLPVKVLHIDGDRLYLKKCIDLYQRLGLQVHGVYVPENEMPYEIEALIQKVQPEIMVVTGHDAYSQGWKKGYSSI